VTGPLGLKYQKQSQSRDKPLFRYRKEDSKRAQIESVGGEVGRRPRGGAAHLGRLQGRLDHAGDADSDPASAMRQVSVSFASERCEPARFRRGEARRFAGYTCNPEPLRRLRSELIDEIARVPPNKPVIPRSRRDRIATLRPSP